MQTVTNPNGEPIAVFDGVRSAVRTDHSPWNKDAMMLQPGRRRGVRRVRDESGRQGEATGILAAYHTIVSHAEFTVYEGGSHGLLITQKHRLNADLLPFLEA